MLDTRAHRPVSRGRSRGRARATDPGFGRPVRIRSGTDTRPRIVLVYRAWAESDLAFTGVPFASPAYIGPNYFPRCFAQDVPPTEAAVLDAAQQPINFPNVPNPAGWGGPRSRPVRRVGRRPDDRPCRRALDGAQTIEFTDASHVGGITRYAAQFAGPIEQSDAGTNH